MFSPHLFDHKFDIDDLIAARLSLGEGQGAPAYLNTRDGTISNTVPQVDDAHRFTLTPVDADFWPGLSAHDDYGQLTDTEARELQTLIQQPHTLHNTVFGPTQLGGWLRERIKEDTLQWLADNNLIPPSMRHINGVPRAKPKPADLPAGIKKVTIS